MIKVIFPDKSVKKFDKGTKVIDVAKSISEGLARKVISASYNDEIVETESLLNEDGEIINNSIGNPEIIHYEYLLPNIYTIDFWFLIMFIILGAFIVSLLEMYGVKKNK